MLTLLILYVGASLLLIALSIPLMLQKIAPNGLYGFRIRPAFDSPEIWYATNKYAAKWLAATGGSVLLAAICLYFVPGISIDVYALGCLAVLVLVLVPGFWLSWRFAQSLAQRRR